jgi:multisubunit Na+/H+ antiporter MnhB subunit
MQPEAKAFFESAASYSETLSGWSLAILGGSVLALLQRSYLRPENKYVRAAYILFGVGWVFLACSIYFGTKVQEVLLSFLAQRQPDFNSLRGTINDDLTNQVNYLGYGLLAFGLWLALYVIWWIVTKQELGGD